MRAEDVYLFRHAMVREAAYELQPPSDRARMHGMVLETVEAAFDDPAALEPWAYDLAEHARLAQVQRRTAKLAELHELARKHLQYLQLAAGFAKRTYDSEQGVVIALAIAEHPQAEDLERAKALSEAGAFLMNLGRLDEAASLTERCLELLRDTAENVLFLDAISTLAVIHLDQGRFDEALKVVTEGVKAAEKAGTPELLGRAHGVMARFYDASDQVEKAEQEYRTAVEIGFKNGLGGMEGVARVNLGGLLQEVGRTAEARECLTRAVELLIEPKHLRARAVALGNLGWVQSNNNETSEAEKTLLSAVELTTRVGSRYDVAVILGNLANVYHDQNRLELALETYQQALDLHLELGTKRHEGTARGDLGHALESCGRYDEAEREYLRAIELGEEMRNTRGVYIAKLMYSETLRRLGRTEEAYAQLKQGLAMATERKDWHWIGTGEGQLCRFLIEDGNESEAEEALHQALKTAAEHNQRGSESMIAKFKQAFGRDPT